MKTLEALYQEILADTELQLSFGSAMKENRMEEFLKENGCEASKEEAEAFLKEKLEKQGELADEELDSVAGGCGSSSKSSASGLDQPLAAEDPEAKFRLIRCYYYVNKKN